MRLAVRVLLLSVVVAFGVFELSASDGTVTPRAAAAIPVGLPPVFQANSTQAVCALTGSHGAYKQGSPSYTESEYGLTSGDSGSSFEFDGKVWWIFGNTGATATVGGLPNASKRWPKVSNLSRGSVALDSDSIATSAEHTSAPAPRAPYNGMAPPPNQHCPLLHFITEKGSVPGPYASPSLSPDPLFPGAGLSVSLRTGELPETGISEGHPARMYVVFGTDSPANCATLSATFQGPCAEPPIGSPGSKGSPNLCKGAKASRTRSVMAVYTGKGVKFTGLYDLSSPSPTKSRYWPTCQTASPSQDAARFVNVQMDNGPDGYLYIWGTEGGANDNRSPVYLARMRASNIATGHGIAYWEDGRFVAGQKGATQPSATPLFTDRPDACVSQLGIEHNPYLDEWIMLYSCKEADPPAGLPNGIYMRTAPDPWGPWSSPTTIFNPAPDRATRSGYCYFIYSTQTASKTKPNGSPICPDPRLNKTLAGPNKRLGSYYGPYFVANWTTGTHATASTRSSTTIYYTLDTFDPYGQLIMRSTILGSRLAGPTIPPCKGSTCS